MLLFDPRRYDASRYDERTRSALLAVRDFFESKGHDALKQESHDAVWYTDFLAMLEREGIFATFGTPAAVGRLIGDEAGATTARWDTARNNDLSELLAWYSLEHWYAWQVTVLGLGPVWMSDNAAAKTLVGKLLATGGVFAFGLSEREHGADIYSTDMVLTPDGDRLAGERRQVLHRQWQLRGAGRRVRPRAATRRPVGESGR